MAGVTRCHFIRVLNIIFIPQKATCKDSGSLDAEDIAKYEGIKSTTDSMIESIKHTIVLLQIAKSYNVDTLYKGEGS